MSTAFDELIESNVWDPLTAIPSVPRHRNPHIYTAYTMRVLEKVGAPVDVAIVRHNYLDFLNDCEIESGVISTLPGSDGVSSHDDAYGACFMDFLFANRCLAHLYENDGVYGKDESTNFYRFFYVVPTMRAWAQLRQGILSQVLYVVSLLWSLLFFKEGETSGMLLLWLSFPAMRENKYVAPFIDYWCEKMTTRGYTPKVIFSKYYLTECPWFGKWASEEWL